MTRRGDEARRVIGMAAAAAACLTLAAAACSGSGGPSTTATTAPPTTALPALGAAQTLELQARAVGRAWPGSRICLNEENTPAGLRIALEPLYEEVVYTEMTTGSPGIGWDTCTLIGPGPVQRYQPGVVGVDVWVVRRPMDADAATYLFRWDGTAWVNATPEETGVTVTTAVS